MFPDILIVLTGFQSHLKQDFRLICKYKVPSHLKPNIYGVQVVKRVSKSKYVQGCTDTRNHHSHQLTSQKSDSKDFPANQIIFLVHRHD